MKSYDEMARERAQSLRASGSCTLLAIESSCDETAAAIVRDGRTVLGSAVHTQIPLHEKYGGVVPELASRSHVERIGTVVEAALRDANMALSQLDAIAVTKGPGLIGALLVGVSYAKGLALAHNLPLVGVNHIAGHVAANYLSHPELKPPFVCLVASGGHSHILYVKDYGKFELLGRTRDDAAGEAFDKVARVLGLTYPGGPKLEKLARTGDPKAFKFHSSFNEGDSPDFSFSGLKTAVINLLHNAEQKGEVLSHADLAASFQHSLVSVLSEKSVRAAKAQGVNTLALAGGVSANSALRGAMQRAAEKAGLTFCCPEFCYCTDNAAMIGCAGYYALMDGAQDGLSLNAFASLPLTGVK